MPHQCTNCGRAFADGSTEMLSGCPDCGGTKFQYSPDGFDGTDQHPAPESSPDPPDRPGDAVTRRVGSAAATVRDLVSGSAGPDATKAHPPSDEDDTGPASPTSDESTGPSSPTVSQPTTEPQSTDGTASATQSTDGTASATQSTDGTASASSSGASAPSPMEAATQTGSGDDDIIVAEPDPSVVNEDTAQADARRELASPDEFPDQDSEDGPDDDASDDFIVADSDGREAPVETSECESMPEQTSEDESVPEQTSEDEPVPEQTSEDEPVPEQTSEDESVLVETSEDESVPEKSAHDRSVAENPDAETTDRPDLAELREELNDQFESIRIVERGQYELNLMELYDRDEVIVALQEDGRYSIRVPEAIGEADA